MKLIIGGAYQGKLDYVMNQFLIYKEEVFYGESSPYDYLSEKKVITNFHLFVKRLLNDKKNVKEEVTHILDQYPDIVIISDEIGCGIVPIDRIEREYREETGRICCYLAKEANEVIRIQCGIPTRIK